MDKAKEAALQAKAQAQHMAQQGQAKVQAVQAGREEGELYKALGEAFYEEQRRGGDRAAVTGALAALDAHFAAAAEGSDGGSAPGSGGGAAGTPAASADPATGAATPPAATPPAATPPAATPGGDFTLDDL